MKKQTWIILGLLLMIASAWGLWRFVPAQLLGDLSPEQVALIQVENGNNGDVFDVRDPEDIAALVEGLQQVSFRRRGLSREPNYWYRLTFLDGDGAEVAALLLQNRSYIRRELGQGRTLVYHSREKGLEAVGKRLELLESALFPDYNKDPDF